jgi:hypothetical protein
MNQLETYEARRAWLENPVRPFGAPPGYKPSAEWLRDMEGAASGPGWQDWLASYLPVANEPDTRPPFVPSPAEFDLRAEVDELAELVADEPQDVASPLGALLSHVRFELDLDELYVEDVMLNPVDAALLRRATEQHFRRLHPELSEAEVRASMAWADLPHESPAVPHGVVLVRSQAARAAAVRAIRFTGGEEERKLVKAIKAGHMTHVPDAVPGTPGLVHLASNDAYYASAYQTEKLVYLTSSGCYYARSHNGQSIELHNPKNEQSAKKYLIGLVGMKPAKARKVLDEMLLPCADTVGCEPDEGAIYVDDQGRTCINTYIPSDIEPEQGSFPVLDEVLSYLTASDKAAKAWLVNWLAFAVQNPTTMIRTAPVLCGAQRTGKSLLANAIRRIVGDENCAAVRNKDMTSGFTGHFVSKLLVVITEAEASDVRHARANAKYFTGEPKVYSEAKGANPVEIKNRMKFIATSNETLPVFVEKNDTRWAILRNDRPAPQGYIDRMASLFGRANEWSDAGLRELRAFAHHLKTFPVDETLAGNVLKNEARQEAIDLGAGSVESFANELDCGVKAVVERLAEGAWERDQLLANLRIPARPDAVATGPLYQLYRRFCAAEGHSQPVASKRFMADLARARPDWTRHYGDQRLRVGREKMSAISGVPFGGGEP